MESADSKNEFFYVSSDGKIEAGKIVSFEERQSALIEGLLDSGDEETVKMIHENPGRIFVIDSGLDALIIVSALEMMKKNAQEPIVLYTKSGQVMMENLQKGNSKT